MRCRRRHLLASGVAVTGGWAAGSFGCSRDTAPSSTASDGRDEAPADLAAEEVEGLLYLREEEKLARDVYLALGEVYALPVFENIAASEQRHMDAMLALLERYGIADNVAGFPVGKLANPELQALHDELVASGKISLESALRAGALIEETDILDLRERAEQTDERVIRDVFANLEQASENHLRAFVRQLSRRGVTYSPVALAQGEYQAILESGQGWGRGRGR